MWLALRLARRGRGRTSPNPTVGAVLVKGGRVIGQGWHHRAGEPHAEIEAIEAARKQARDPRGSVLYVTLEPCCTHGRTPPCTRAIIDAGICKVVVGAVDPNPRHAGRGLKVLRQAGLEVRSLTEKAPRQAGLLRACRELNAAFNHWIVHRTPFVTVKTGMSLDGKIATVTGESKWITGNEARVHAMRLRHEHDAILVGINTILNDDPSLTLRRRDGRAWLRPGNPLRRVILDSEARTPLTAAVVNDTFASHTTVIVSRQASVRRIEQLAKHVRVLRAPSSKSGLDLRWVLRRLGAENVTSLLVEGGGEVNASFLRQGLPQRVAFFYAPKILGGRTAPKAVAGPDARSLAKAVRLIDPQWRRVGADLFLSATVAARSTRLQH